VILGRVLGRMFGPMKQEISRGSRKLDDEFYNLCHSPDIIIMIHGWERSAYKVLIEQPDEAHLEDQVIDRRIILKWILTKLMGGCEGD
jgi:hypothetical protein